MMRGSFLRAVVSPVLVVSLGTLAAPGSLFAQDQDRPHANQQNNPVHDAKAFQKLSQDMMTQLGKQASDGDFLAAIQTLTSYRDTAQTTFNGLRTSGVDAERHSDGFRQLQICLRKGIWELERTLPIIPDEHKAIFRSLTDNLVDMQTQLVHLLFPRDSAVPKDPPKDKPKN